jgi:hypothetical protein
MYTYTDIDMIRELVEKAIDIMQLCISAQLFVRKNDDLTNRGSWMANLAMLNSPITLSPALLRKCPCII